MNCECCCSFFYVYTTTTTTIARIVTDYLVLSSAWIINTDLSPLDPESCKDVQEKGKSKLLVEAYKVAAEGHDLQHFKNILSEHQRLLEEEIRAQEELAAEKEAKKEKKKRKSIAAKGDDEDEGAEEAGGEKRKSAKKRKKEMESEGETDKVRHMSTIHLKLSLLWNFPAHVEKCDCD